MTKRSRIDSRYMRFHELTVGLCKNASEARSCWQAPTVRKNPEGRLLSRLRSELRERVTRLGSTSNPLGSCHPTLQLRNQLLNAFASTLRSRLFFAPPRRAAWLTAQLLAMPSAQQASHLPKKRYENFRLQEIIDVHPNYRR